MTELLHGIEGVEVIIDGILIHGKTRKEHNAGLSVSQNPGFRIDIEPWQVWILKDWDRIYGHIFIPALSKESLGILLLPLSVHPSVRPSERKVCHWNSAYILRIWEMTL